MRWPSLWVWLGLALLAFSLPGAQVSAEVGPSESECRPHIEKAINSLKTGDPETDSSNEDGLVNSIETDGRVEDDDNDQDDDGIPDHIDDDDDNDGNVDGTSQENDDDDDKEGDQDGDDAQSEEVVSRKRRSLDESVNANDDDGASDENQDNDGSDEEIRDIDKDGIPDHLDDDLDGDGIPNHLDDDLDGDGIPNHLDDDIDGDGIPNHLDDDMDGDGILNHLDDDADGKSSEKTDEGGEDSGEDKNQEDNDDSKENNDDEDSNEARDTDGDGIPDHLDDDLDGDGIPNHLDDDLDGDGIPNHLDDDIDGDGLLNHLDEDMDGDGVANHLDDDADGKSGEKTGDDDDSEEVQDKDGDGIPDHLDDDDGSEEELQDTDGDGIPDHLDDDLDGDGIPNHLDDDVDGDGIPNHLDDDIDGDGIPNHMDQDMDGDGVENHLDDDADGKSGEKTEDSGEDNDANDKNDDEDSEEIQDKDKDGIPDHLDNDDGSEETDDNKSNENDQNNDSEENADKDDDSEEVLDQDGDGIPDHLDDDMDGDGIPNDQDDDIDGDGIPNHLDNDIDGDGIPNDQDDDKDGDGIPNDLDTEAEGKSGEEESAEETQSKTVDASPEEADSNEEEDDGHPENDLLIEFKIPKNLRSRDHIADLLHLDDESAVQEQIINNNADVILKDLKRIYENAIKPLETLYKYRDLSNRHFGDAEIFSKPLVLFMGPWSGGKSTLINYLTGNEHTEDSLRTGAEPSPAYFNILMHGDKPEVLDGTQLAADWTFSGLQKFGQGLEDRLRGLKLPNKLLEKVNIVEIPGILEVRKQVSRLFPFNDACQWFIDRADIIFLVYDPSKLDVGPETEAILDQLKGREYQTRILLNKADQVKPEELLRVQSALIWNISPLMSSAQPPVMYTTSLWSHPFEKWAPSRLLIAQERAMLRDLRTAIDKRIENKIASARRFAVRVRNHAKMVDCYLTTYYNHKTLFGNKRVIADQIIDNPQNYHIYEGLSTLTNISRYDLPDPDVYRSFFRLNPVYEFKKLSETCTYFRGCPINKLDISIAYDLPELAGKYKKLVDKAMHELENEEEDVTKKKPPGS